MAAVNLITFMHETINTVILSMESRYLNIFQYKFCLFYIALFRSFNYFWTIDGYFGNGHAFFFSFQIKGFGMRIMNFFSFLRSILQVRIFICMRSASLVAK